MSTAFKNGVVKIDKFTLCRLRNGFYLCRYLGDGSADADLDVVDEMIALDDDDVLQKVREWLGVETER